jgi:hypothetical protein
VLQDTAQGNLLPGPMLESQIQALMLVEEYYFFLPTMLRNLFDVAVNYKED